MSEQESYFSGCMIGFGLVTFMSYLVACSMQVQGDTINALAVVGGLGFNSLCFGIYLLIKNRKDIKIEYTDEYLEFRRANQRRFEKNKQESDLILKKYESMPDLSKRQKVK